MRYQPNSLDAVDDHRGKIALLIGDVDGVIPPEILERVAGAWALKSPYMPKASDLIEAAHQTQLVKPPTGRTWVQRCDDANAKKRQTMMTLEPGEANRQEAFWWAVVGAGDGTGLQLKYTAQAAA